MDEFFSGNNLRPEICSNVYQKSRKKIRLRADVKLKIKQRLHLHRDKAILRETQVDNNTGVIVANGSSEIQNLSKHAGVNNRLSLAKVVDRLWNLKRHPQLNSEKFLYSGRVPCFLHRNTRKIDKKGRLRPAKRPKKIQTFYDWQRRNRVHRKQKATREFYFRFKRVSNKRPACSSFDQNQAKRLCLESEYRKLREKSVPENIDSPLPLALIKQTYDDEGSKSFLTRIDRNSDCSSNTIEFNDDSDTEEITPAEEKLSKISQNPKQPFPKSCISRRNGSDLEGYPAKTRASVYKVPEAEETTNENFDTNNSESQTYCKPFSYKEKRHEVFDNREKHLNVESRQDHLKLSSSKEKCMNKLEVSRMDCFISGLHAKKKFSQGSLQTTSTPERSIQTTSTPKRSIQTTSTPERSIQTTSTPKAKRVFTKTAMVPKWHTNPPESELADEEISVLAPKHLEKNRFRANSKNVAERIIYKPLFSNRPRLWKSVVVENDS